MIKKILSGGNGYEKVYSDIIRQKILRHVKVVKRDALIRLQECI
jgi:hypothetical protein